MRRFGWPLALAVLVLAGGCGDDATTGGDPGTPGGGGLQAQGPVHWWNDQVFYEVFVRSFHDSDGDGVGDLQGLIDRLDYLNDGDPGTDTDLGVTALWLMPLTAAPSYHGYDTTDYRTIEPDYGTNADFRRLVGEAHARGMRIVVDYVMNHCSDEHPWFAASNAGDPQRRGWFSWRGTNPGWTQPWGGGPVWHAGTSGYYYGVFWSGMPDLNYTNPAVADEMLATASWWLDDMGADGFRLDAVRYLIEDGAVLEDTDATFAFWRRFRAHLDATAPDAFVVGEAWANTGTVLRYIDAGLHTCFEFDLARAMMDGVKVAAVDLVRDKIEQVAADFPFQQYATFLTNHDQDRVFEEMRRDPALNATVAAVLLTAPGVPFLYYGEEVGMLGEGRHENIRRPMQWTAGPGAGFTTGTPWYGLNPNYAQWNVETLAADDESLWHAYRRLIQARTASPALRRGTYHSLEADRDVVYAFLRRYEDDAVVAVHNFSRNTQGGFRVSSGASQLPPGLYEAEDMLTGAALEPLTVGAGGSIAGWEPVSFLTGGASLLARLTPVPEPVAEG